MILYKSWAELRAHLPGARMVQLCHKASEAYDYIKSFEGMTCWRFGIWHMSHGFYVIAMSEKGYKK